MKIYITAAAILAAAFSVTAAADTVLRFNRWIPATNFTQSDIFDPWARDIAKATDGRVKIEFTASSLAPPPRQYQLAMDGISDVVWHAHGYTPGVFPLSEMVELPFTGDSAEAISVAYWRVYKKYLEPANMHRGVVTLAVHVTPPGGIYNNKHAITKLEDFRGLKIRSTNALVTTALKMFGAVPIAAPVTEIREGLSRGVMDGTTFTDDAIFSFKIAPFVKFATKVPGGLYNQSFVVAITPKKWQELSEADRAALSKLSGEAFARRLGSVWDGVGAKAVAELKAAGIGVHVAQGPLLQDMREKLAPFERDWIARAKASGVDGQAALAMLRAEIAAFKAR
jgi:TRAP-type C4-dicarboxylate transport system substrate-binding protein